jgi:hypothetical protein
MASSHTKQLYRRSSRLCVFAVLLALGCFLPTQAWTHGDNIDCDPCTIDADCDPGNICVDEHCVPADCSTDADCSEGEICENGRCVPEQCADDEDCSDGEICEDGRCVPEECVVDEDCPDGEECVDGRCEFVEPCGETPDCAVLDSFCGMGFCDAETQTCQLEPLNEGVECDVNEDACVIADLCLGGACTALPVCVPGCELCDAGECTSLCGNPFDSTGSSTTAADALFTLRAAVGSETCELCLCDLTGDGAVTASDALAVLHVAVKLPLVLDCPLPGESTTTTTTSSTLTTMLFETTTSTSTTSTTLELF